MFALDFCTPSLGLFDLIFATKARFTAALYSGCGVADFFRCQHARAWKNNGMRYSWQMHKKKSRTLFLISKTHMHQHSKTTHTSIINHNRSIIKRTFFGYCLSTGIVLVQQLQVNSQFIPPSLSKYSLLLSWVESSRVHDIAFKIKSNKIPGFAWHKTLNQTNTN